MCRGDRVGPSMESELAAAAHRLSHRHFLYNQASVPVKAQGVEDSFFHDYLEKMLSYLFFSMWI